MSVNKPVQLGLCCINTQLRFQKPPVFASRKMIIRSIVEQGIDVLKSKIIQNLKDVLTMMEWNEQNGIKVFRLSSELFPHKSNPKVDDYTFDFAKPLLIEIGKLAHKYNQRLTFHPGQYNVVGSPNRESFIKTRDDLSYHAEVLDLCQLDGLSPVMVVHGGGIYGNKDETILRWCSQYLELPENVRKYLVLENCEKCFNIEDCLRISKMVNIPVVFDTHHYLCYRILHPHEPFKPASQYIPAILETWKRRGLKPKFHVSEQGSGRIGHHSNFVDTIPSYLLNIPVKYGFDIDIMIEAKMKEQSIQQLYIKYPRLNCKINPSCISVSSIPGAGWVNKMCADNCCIKKNSKHKKILIMKCCGKRANKICQCIYQPSH